MMVTVGMNYTVLPGKGEAFETVFYKVLDVMNAMEGHKISFLYKDVRDPQRYLILSEWHSRSAFEAFTKSDRFRSVVDWGKEQILAERPKHEVYGQDEPAAAAKCPVPH
jgi:heme-degrading monooxygenase HmoA